MTPEQVQKLVSKTYWPVRVTTNGKTYTGWVKKAAVK